MKAKKLRSLTRIELEQRLREAGEELFNLKFQQKTGQLSNPLRIREVRKDVARLTTLLKEREATGGEPAAGGVQQTE